MSASLIWKWCWHVTLGNTKTYRLGDVLCGPDLPEFQVAWILGHGLTQLKTHTQFASVFTKEKRQISSRLSRFGTWKPEMSHADRHQMKFQINMRPHRLPQCCWHQRISRYSYGIMTAIKVIKYFYFIPSNKIVLSICNNIFTAKL